LYTKNQLPRLTGSDIFFDGTPILFFLHILSGWVKIRLYTENQLPRLPGSALKVPVVGGVVASYPLSSQAPTPVEVELGCDNFGGVNEYIRCRYSSPVTATVVHLNLFLHWLYV
jgi:hypothetical protein